MKYASVLISPVSRSFPVFFQQPSALVSVKHEAFHTNCFPIGFVGETGNNESGISVLRTVLMHTAYESMLPAMDVLSKEVLNFGAALHSLEDILLSFDDDTRYLISMDVQQ